MPTLKAIHICNSHQPTLQPKIAKEYVFANADRPPKKKYDRTTMAIRNAGESADMKVITLNKLRTKLKVKCLAIPHYA
ncbi:MAG: hypothetical protein HN778_01170 [Prolixibacteraceae bacterium]|jgi:hypothetical protein|nr:hypothetical protein [Prolixibacteraceae bacterium]